MADLQLDRPQTALINAGRTKKSNPTIGDFFEALIDRLTATIYNAIVDDYLALEGQIHLTISAGFKVYGKDENNAQVGIDDDPGHPLPIHK